MFLNFFDFEPKIIRKSFLSDTGLHYSVYDSKAGCVHFKTSSVKLASVLLS